ncbi:hypothetical protein ACG7TL_006966 [Trametes sanguinea]
MLVIVPPQIVVDASDRDDLMSGSAQELESRGWEDISNVEVGGRGFHPRLTLLAIGGVTMLAPDLQGSDLNSTTFVKLLVWPTYRSLEEWTALIKNPSVDLSGATETGRIRSDGVTVDLQSLFVKSLMTDTVSDYIKLQAFDIALSTVTATTDVLLSATLVTLLVRSRTGSPSESRGVGPGLTVVPPLPRSNRLINKLLFYTINTGLMTSVCAVLSLIMGGVHPNSYRRDSPQVLVSPATSIYVMFYYIGAHLYSVSLLATLNARAALRAQAQNLENTAAPTQLADLLQRISPRPRARVRDRRASDDVPSTWGRTDTHIVRPGDLADQVASYQPPLSIVVSIQRHTTVTFDDDLGAGCKAGAGVHSERSPRDGKFLDLDRAVEGMYVRRASDSWIDVTRLTPSPDLELK